LIHFVGRIVVDAEFSSGGREERAVLSLFVDFFAMSDARNAYDFAAIVDDVNNAIIPDADAP
jgi:hypothetical protein